MTTGTQGNEKRRRKGRRALWAGIALLLLGAGFLVGLPRLLSTDLGRRATLKLVNSRIDGKLRVERWALRWRGNTRIRGLAFSDDASTVDLKVEVVSLSSGLLALLPRHRRLGEVTLERPHLLYVLPQPEAPVPRRRHRPRKRPRKPPEPASPRADLTAKISVVRGHVQFRPAVSEPPICGFGFNASLDIDGLDRPLVVNLAAASTAPATGSVVRVSGPLMLFRDGAIDPTHVGGDLEVDLQDFDLRLLEPLQTRVPGLPLMNGTLTADLALRLAGTATVRVTGFLEGQEITLEGGALGTDRPVLPHLRLDADVDYRNGGLSVRKLKAVCPIATLTADGDLVPSPGRLYPTGGLQLLAEVSLPQMAAQFPQTLHLRRDLTVTGGRLALEMRLQSDGEAAGLHLDAELSDLRAQRGTAALAQAAPATLKAHASFGTEGLLLDESVLQTSFGSLTAGGRLTGGEAKLQLDLGLAREEVGRFIDLGSLQLGGQVAADADIRLSTGDGKACFLNLRVQDFHLAGMTSAVPQVSGDFTAQLNGRLTTPSDFALEGFVAASALQLSRGPLGEDTPVFDELRVDVTAMRKSGIVTIEKARMRSAPAILSLEGQFDATGMNRVGGEMALQGEIDLPELCNRLPHTLGLGAWRVTQGRAETEGSVHFAQSAVTGKVVVAVGDMAVRQGETEVELPGPIRLEAAAHRGDDAWRIDTLTLQAPFGHLAGQGDADRAEATLALDLEPALAPFRGLMKPDTVTPAGQLQARLSVREKSPEVGVLTLTSQVDDFTVGEAAPMLLTAFFRADVGREEIRFEAFRLDSPPLMLDATGRLQRGPADGRLDAEGRWGTDLASLTTVVTALGGSLPPMRGSSTNDFRLSLPLEAGAWTNWIRGATGATGLQAEAITLPGAVARDVDLSIDLVDGELLCNARARVNEGKVTMQPTLDLRSEPRLIFPPESRLCEGVQLNDAMASELLARVHPLFRGCAVLGGEADLTLAQGLVPMTRERVVDALLDGEIAFRNLQLGPGGLLKDILNLLKVDVDKAIVTNQLVNFSCRDGRVQPSPLTVQAGDYRLVVSGSVGLDQSLDYQVAVPISEAMVGADAYRYLRNTSIKLPVGGTVTKPELSRAAYEQMLRGLVRDSLRNAVQSEGRRLLEGLFER